MLLFSHEIVFNSVTPWTIAHQAPLSMGFPRQEDCSGLPFPSPGDLPDPGIESAVSCTGRQIPYHWPTREDTVDSAYFLNYFKHFSFKM